VPNAANSSNKPLVDRHGEHDVSRLVPADDIAGGEPVDQDGPHDLGIAEVRDEAVEGVAWHGRPGMIERPAVAPMSIVSFGLDVERCIDNIIVFPLFHEKTTSTA
jgi:hypothetical protein